LFYDKINDDGVDDENALSPRTAVGELTALSQTLATVRGLFLREGESSFKAIGGTGERTEREWL